ncbi:MAG: MarR family transcriptional regulator [Acidobacteria bacterium]|nr:MarR family transcriptional regulator [Acidobacteriota bacterium]MBU4255583.1 MarR family transcriptional regulator [Acidobacteriota bacterium]MBU4330000.1 MarR family transcriptional regulator [Acidobacteriota bacterium]MBU4495131.1 MarR family transcriptional regulator [Acidobacteriota bacterium]MCG2816516.1 MarR family transcriptional regulator [Candidatus Aminicenantes bacterium]
MKQEFEFENTVKDIVWSLRRISQLIYQDSRKMANQFGITAPQSYVLKTLYQSEESLSSVNLSHQLGVTPSNITGIIDRLEEKGLLKRKQKENDRRTMLIELSVTGKEMSSTLPDVVELKLINGLKDLKSTEIFGIYSALQKIIETVGSEIPSQETILNFE